MLPRWALAAAALPLLALMRRLVQSRAAPWTRRRAAPSAARQATATPVAAQATPYGCPLPPVVHARLEQLKPGRVIIVGDCHGVPELFTLLHDILSYDASHDNLLLVGDLVNKGPASLEVLDSLPRLDAHAVRGNHDDACLAAWLRLRRGGALHSSGAGGASGTDSASDGGGSGGGDKMAWVPRMSEEQAARLAGLPFSLSVPDYGIAVVHAGMVPGVPIEHQELWALYKMRNLVKAEAEAGAASANGHAPGAQQHPPPRYVPVEKLRDGGEPWAAAWHQAPHLFFGHDARRGLQLHPAATGLDTAAVYGGRLTAAVLPPLAELEARAPGFAARARAGAVLSREDLGVRFVSVEAARVYSPPSEAPVGPAAAAAAGAGAGAAAPSGSAPGAVAGLSLPPHAQAVQAGEAVVAQTEAKAHPEAVVLGSSGEERRQRGEAR